jgi:hypothetical protein
MPIRPDLRPFYRGPAWRAARRRILERAGGVFRIGPRGGAYYVGGARCRDCRRVQAISFKPRGRKSFQVGVAHLDQDAANRAASNLAVLCRGCHNKHDGRARAQNAKGTRCQRKDASRPLLPA